MQQHQASVLFKLLELKHLPYLSWSHSLWFFTSQEGIPPANPSLSLRPFLKASHKEVAPWILNPWMLYLSVVLGRMKIDFPFDYSLHIFHRYGAEVSSSSCLKWDTACRFSTCVERKVFLSTFVVSVNNWYLSYKVIDIIQQKLSRTCLFSSVNQSLQTNQFSNSRTSVVTYKLICARVNNEGWHHSQSRRASWSCRCTAWWLN